MIDSVRALCGAKDGEKGGVKLGMVGQPFNVRRSSIMSMLSFDRVLFLEVPN